MGKSYLDHSIGSVRDNNHLGTGLVYGLIGVEKQLRLKGWNQENAGLMSRRGLCSSNLHQQMLRARLKVDSAGFLHESRKICWEQFMTFSTTF